MISAPFWLYQIWKFITPGLKSNEKRYGITFVAASSGLFAMGAVLAYFSLKATIVYIKQDSFCYPACRSADCNKKVTDMGDGTWRCEKCDINHDKPEYRYVMSVNVNDHTGQLWLSCFDEVGRVIMGGKTAAELMAMKEDDEAALTATWDAANCTKLSFRCRAKMDTFGEAQR